MKISEFHDEGGPDTVVSPLISSELLLEHDIFKIDFISCSLTHHPYYSGSGAGTGLKGRGHTTLGWVTGVYLSTVAGWRLQSFTSRQWIKYDLRRKPKFIENNFLFRIVILNDR